MDRDTAIKASAAYIGFFGVLFLLFPKLGARLFGLDPDAEPTAQYPTRYFGVRSLALAALLARPETSDAAVKAVPVIAAGDLAANVFATASGEVPKKTVAMGVVASGIGAALGFAAAKD